MSEAPGGLVEERHIGLMIAVPIFLLINAVLAYFGGRMMSNMQHKSNEDVLTAHYLGGRSFGPILSLGTMVRLILGPNRYVKLLLFYSFAFVARPLLLPTFLVCQYILRLCRHRYAK